MIILKFLGPKIRILIFNRLAESGGCFFNSYRRVIPPVWFKRFFVSSLKPPLQVFRLNSIG
jgi:hypothetical protein